MRAALAALLLLTGCSAPRLPGVRYIETSPENIKQTACAFRVPNCHRILGMTFLEWSPKTVFVPPYTARTAFIWRHENRHVLEGQFHRQLAEGE